MGNFRFLISHIIAHLIIICWTFHKLQIYRRQWTQNGNEMNAVLGHDTALSGYTEPGTTWANEMSIVMNHVLLQDRSLHLLTSSPARYQDLR